MASVTLRNLNKVFTDQQTKKEVHAVKDMNLEIRDGEFLVLVGPSGCGKTTSMRMVAGLEESTGGEILIGDRVVNDVAPRDRNIAMVFQNYALYPHMTVYDNMAFGLRLRMLPPFYKQLMNWSETQTIKADIDKRIRETAKTLGIDQLLDRKPKALSGGQRQRVALGRAIVREPQVFLMDEPLSNLDAKLRVQTRADLIKLHRQLKVTTIYVTHDQVEAMTMGERIVVMKDGLMQQCDTPMELYKHPVNMFVAGFLGTPSMNFLHETKVTIDDDTATLENGFTVKVSGDRAKKLAAYNGKTVVLGIRPQDMVEKSFSGSIVHPSDTVRMQVDVIETMGAVKTLYLTVGKSSLVAEVDAESPAKELAPIDVVFDLDTVHAFDPSTEQAIF